METNLLSEESFFRAGQHLKTFQYFSVVTSIIWLIYLGIILQMAQPDVLLVVQESLKNSGKKQNFAASFYFKIIFYHYQ